MRNPYVVGNWVCGRDFYGREALIDEILHGPHRALYVMGNRRVGKTSLLRQIETLAPAIFLDFQKVGPGMDGLARELKREIGRKARQSEEYQPLAESVIHDDAFGVLETLDEKAEEAGIRLFLLCDESEVLLSICQQNPAALMRLRGVLQGCSALRTVLTATKNLTRLNDLCRNWATSPFLHGFAVHYLAGLTDKEAESLIWQDHLATPVEAEAAIISDIRARTNNHPYLIQLLCHRLFQHDGRLRPIAGNDLIVSEQLAACLGNDFEYLSAGEQCILHQVSLVGQATAQELQEAIDISGLLTFLDGLTRLGYLQQEGKSYAIGNEFLARWLRDYVPSEEKSEVSDEGMLRAYLRVFISHSSKDRPFVERLAQDLKQAGVKVWYADWEIRVGDSIVRKINEGLEESDYLLVVLSPEAVASPWVQAELSAALMDELSRRHIRVLPVLHRDCAIPPLLRDLRYADFRSNYDAGLQQVLRSLGL